MSHRQLLDPSRHASEVANLVEELRKKVIGQEQAVRYFARALTSYKSEIRNPALPISSALFLGPTGVGKTRTVEAVAENIFGDANAITKIDCAEFQLDIETSKLVGSPPGYKGHKTSDPIFTQKRIDWHHTHEHKLSFVLFDEVEKASPLLWNIILSILKQGKVSIFDNSKVSFAKSIVILTSNVGASQMSELISNCIGFAPTKTPKDLDSKIENAALRAAQRRFPNDFMGELGKVVIFRKLEQDEIKQILDIELVRLQDRITSSAKTKFIFFCSEEAKKLILKEGFDLQYGGRHLNRAVERLLTIPLSNLVGS